MKVACLDAELLRPRERRLQRYLAVCEFVSRVANLFHELRICFTSCEFVSRVANLFHKLRICFTSCEFVSQVANLFHELRFFFSYFFLGKVEKWHKKYPHQKE